MDTCLLRQLQRQVNSMDLELSDVAHKILLLDSGEEALMEEWSQVKKVYSQGRFEARAAIAGHGEWPQTQQSRDS